MASAPPKIKSAVDAYAKSVLAGEVLTGHLVQLACERHLRDLETGGARHLFFDYEEAEKVIAFFPLLRHSKGEWAGQPFILEPWQAFIIGSIFGWKRRDGTRRFRTAYNEVARKNGKSTLSAGIGLKLAFFDNEAGAEVYSAATKREQAKIVWGEAQRMVKSTPGLKGRITAFVGNLHQESSNSKFEPLGADEDSLDGLNIHGAIIDELHAHKSRVVWDILETATGSRRQPLIFVITTAGFDRNSICWQQHDYGVKVLEGILEDDTYFAYIAQLDPGDSWLDSGVWPKANPNLEVSLKLLDLETLCARAKEMPSAQYAFRRLHLDEWTEAESRWLDVGVYDSNNIHSLDSSEYKGHLSFMGLDLSTTVDITAWVSLFRCQHEEGAYDILPLFFVPGDAVQKRVLRDRVPYDLWIRQGFIIATAGNVIDYDAIRERIKVRATEVDIRELGYDPWNATQLATQLESDGARIAPVRQGYISLSEPTKALEALILSRKFHHGGNPVLRWMFSNVIIEQDASGNMKPSKAKSTERIDGVVATIIALSCAIRHGEGRSIYEERGLIIL